MSGVCVAKTLYPPAFLQLGSLWSVHHSEVKETSIQVDQETVGIGKLVSVARNFVLCRDLFLKKRYNSASNHLSLGLFRDIVDPCISELKSVNPN